MSEPVLLTRDGAVAAVVLNRPERRNALNTEAKVGLREALAQVAADSSVRAVVLSGAGNAFCVGQDLIEHKAALDADPGAALVTVDLHYNPIVTLLTTMPKPVVAAVSGSCVGAGLGLALACDLRVMSRTASFGTAFTAIGLTCDSGLSALLVDAVGRARASQLVLLGEVFGADQALAWGIAGLVVEPDEVTERAHDLARRLADGPTRAFAESKALLAAAGSRPLADTLAAEARAQIRLGQTEDHLAAVAAFAAKQKPSFSGR